MGFLDRAKARAADAVGKHGGKIDQGLNKAGDMADKRTQGKHTDKIAGARGKASDALKKLNRKEGTPPSTPPAGTPPTTSSTEGGSTDNTPPPPVR